MHGNTECSGFMQDLKSLVRTAKCYLIQPGNLSLSDQCKYIYCCSAFEIVNICSKTYGMPLTTKFVIQFWYSIFVVDINYFILIFNFDVCDVIVYEVVQFIC